VEVGFALALPLLRLLWLMSLMVAVEEEGRYWMLSGGLRI
jgi:hypothetical protein